MHSLPPGGPDSGWDSTLLRDLDHIKSRLRYPVRVKTLAPVLFWSLLIVLLAAVILASYFQKLAAGQRPGGLPVIMGLSSLVLITTILVRYLRSLRFITLPTGLFLQENARLIEAFLKAQRMLVFRHPEAPEVYQIISRNISAGKEDREVLIFIADDRRILLNSHFTNAGWGFSPQGHHHQMAALLRKFIESATMPKDRSVRVKDDRGEQRG